MLCYLPPVILGFAPLLLYSIYSATGATVIWDWKASFFGQFHANGNYSMGSAAWWIVVPMLEGLRFAECCTA